MGRLSIWHAHRARSGGSRALDDSSPCDTTPQYKTHRTELRKVQYPWHPLFGREVLIGRRHRRLQAKVFDCQMPEQERRRGFEIPQWMFDSAACSRMQVTSDPPHVWWAALRELKQLLEETSPASTSAMVEARHRSFLDNKGDADGQSPTNSATRPAEPVPASAGSPAVAIASTEESRDCGAAVGAATSRPYEASAGRSKRRGRRR